MAPARNNFRSIKPDSSSWLLVNPSPTSSEISYLPSDLDTNGQHYIISRTSHHRRSPLPAYPSHHAESSRSTRSTAASGTSSARNRHAPPGSCPPPIVNTTPIPSAVDRNHLLAGIMSRSGPFPSSGSSSRNTASYPAQSPDRRSASSGGRRRLRGVAAGQDSPTSSVAATDGSYRSDKQEEGGSAAGGSGSGSSSSAGGGGGSGMKLTEQNVSKTSRFYDYLSRDRDRERDSEGSGSKGRMAAIDATIKAAGKKMGDSRK